MVGKELRNAQGGRLGGWTLFCEQSVEGRVKKCDTSVEKGRLFHTAPLA